MNYMIAFIAGTFVIFSMIINSELSKKIGALQSAFINYFVGFILSVLILAVFQLNINIPFNTIPTYAYFGGVIGVSIVVISNKVIPKIPVIYSTILIFVGQITGGIILDYLLNDIFSFGKVIGAFIILLGVLMNLYFDHPHQFTQKFKKLLT